MPIFYWRKNWLIFNLWIFKIYSCFCFNFFNNLYYFYFNYFPFKINLLQNKEFKIKLINIHFILLFLQFSYYIHSIIVYSFIQNLIFYFIFNHLNLGLETNMIKTYQFRFNTMNFTKFFHPYYYFICFFIIFYQTIIPIYC